MQVLKTIPEGSRTYDSILEELDVESKIPACLQHIWEWFWELRRTAGSGFATPNPITFTEIYNWAKLKGIMIYPFEVEIIKRLDDVFIEYSSERTKKRKKQNKGKNKSKLRE